MRHLPDCSAELSVPDAMAERILDRARREQWDVERDVDWSLLDLGAMPLSIRSAMSELYTQILFGEVVAMQQSAKVVREAPHPWVRQYALTQVVDEARHVEFFSRVVAKLGVEFPIEDKLRAFAEELDAVDTVDQGLLGTQVILESFAQTVFVEGARATNRARSAAIRLPGGDAAAHLMEHLIHRVGRDESRHVAFGVTFLRRRAASLDSAVRARLERSATKLSTSLDAMLARLAPAFARIGLDPQEVQTRAEAVRHKHLSLVFGAVGQSELEALTA